MEWSPQQAMKAYINTLELSKALKYEDSNMGQPPPKAMEPECMELISALAAGNKAKMMVEIASGGPTPFTVALAVAAKQTGGRVVCVLPPSGRPAIHDNRLSGVVDFVAAGNPSEAIMRGVDFLVVDSAAAPENGGGGGGGEVWEKVEVSPKGCVVVATNVRGGGRGRSGVGEITKGKKGFVESLTLPIGNGVELTKIRSSWDTTKKKTTRRLKRFHVTYENY